MSKPRYPAMPPLPELWTAEALREYGTIRGYGVRQHRHEARRRRLTVTRPYLTEQEAAEFRMLFADLRESVSRKGRR